MSEQESRYAELEAKLSEGVTKTSTLLDEGFACDDEGQVTYDQAVIDKYLEDSIGMETIEHVQSLISELGSGALLTLVKKAPSEMDSRNLRRLSGTFNVGKERMAVNYNAPAGTDEEGNPKDPVITLVNRRYVHPDHDTVRQMGYELRRSMTSKK